MPPSLRHIARLLPALCLLCITAGAALAEQNITITVNPYQHVDWDRVKHHKAALHVHTLQSDGRHMVREVVHAYKAAGFTIVALTDHDQVGPNYRVPEGEKGTYYPKGPRPDNYPANTTWPWTDYGTEAPQELGMLGIESAELSFRHHMNSYFTDYGTQGNYAIARKMKTHSEDDQLLHVKATEGIAIINHPGIDAKWWERKALDWYAQRFETHSPDHLIGMEVTNGRPSWEAYDEGLWDQLLARFMPHRPIWGFGTDDMHQMENYHQSHTVILVDELDETAVRDAMQRGQFYFTKSTRRADLRQPDQLDTFPVIDRIRIDEAAGTITIEGSGYDRIRWISAPESLEAQADYQTSNSPWPPGRVVHEGDTLNYRSTPGIQTYIRAELHRTEGDHLLRTFTNPFGIEQE